MAIYQPPKNSGIGETLSTIGAGAMGISALTGPAAPFVAVGGAIASLAGTVISGNEKEKSANYESMYANKVQGEQNQQISYQNNLNQSKVNYTQPGVMSSIKAINGMINPSSNVPSNGGTGISNNRLI